MELYEPKQNSLNNFRAKVSYKVYAYPSRGMSNVTKT